MEPISPKHITVTDPFWAPRIRTVADIVLPYQWQVLHDQVPGAPKSSCIANFQKAAYAIPYGNRAYLTEKSREAVEIIAAAQETDGYLDTLYSINGLQNRFTNLKDYHELYCFGHLAQAACARWTMQGRAGPIGYCLPSSRLHLPHLWQRKAPRLSRPPAGRAGTGTTV